LDERPPSSVPRTRSATDWSSGLRSLSSRKVNNPTAQNVDTSIEKTTLFRERLRLTFRAELFNATNHVVFSGPTTSITSATFGKIILSQTNSPRQVQFSLRLGF